MEQKDAERIAAGAEGKVLVWWQSEPRKPNRLELQARIEGEGEGEAV